MHRERTHIMNSRISIPWSEVEGAVFLIGLAIIAWQGWWWPGILIVIAVTAIVEGISRQQKRDEKEHKASRRASALPTSESTEDAPAPVEPALALPDRCPNCGGDINPDTVDRHAGRVDCPYCGTRLGSAMTARAA